MGEAGSKCGGKGRKDDEGEKAAMLHQHHGKRVAETIEDGDHEPLSRSTGRANTGYFGIAALVTQTILTSLFFFTGYDLTSLTVFNSSQAYDFYVGIGVMLFVGFGYLNTFLKCYGLSSIGFTMFIGCLGIQWALLLQGWMGTGQFRLAFNVVSFIRANQSVAAVLVSFGAVLGKTSPLQILVLVMIEMVCVTVNKIYIMDKLGVMDIGGTMSVHVFGAFFGLFLSFCSAPRNSKNSKGDKVFAPNEDEFGSTYTSDILAMLGTVFMWLFWPCFNGGDLTMGTAQQKMAIMNTVFALCGSTVTTFAMSTLCTKQQRLTTSPIQMATLAGGVAVGAVANFAVLPGGAVLIGMGGGAISTCSFLWLHNVLEDKWDTTGVMSLHGIPGLFGAVVSIFLPLFVKTVPIEAGKQALGLLCVTVNAIICGSVTGYVLAYSGKQPAVAYNDEAYWDVES